MTSIIERYNVGAKVIKGDVIAKVIIERTQKNIMLKKDEYNEFYRFWIKIRFTEKKTPTQLKELGINLDDSYSRVGKTWESKLGENETLKEKLFKLESIGFDIWLDARNKDYRNLVAALI